MTEPSAVLDSALRRLAGTHGQRPLQEQMRKIRLETLTLSEKAGLTGTQICRGLFELYLNVNFRLYLTSKILCLKSPGRCLLKTNEVQNSHSIFSLFLRQDLQ